MAVQDPYLVPLEDPTRTELTKEEQASDPYLTPLKDPKRIELTDEEQSTLTEKGIEKLRKQGFPEAVLWSLQAPGGSWTDFAVNVGGGIAGSIGGGVLGAAAGPVGVGVGAATGGASAGGLADYWSQLREYAREGGGDEDFKLKKGRFGASVVLGGIVPAPVKSLRPIMTNLPSREVLKNIPNPNAARYVLGPGLQRSLAERLPGEFAQDAANYAMTRGAQGAVMAAGQNVAEQVIDTPPNTDFDFTKLGLSALGGAGVGAVIGVAERSAPPTWAWVRENVPQAWAKIRGKTPSEAAAILQADPLVVQAWAAAKEIEQRAATTVKPAAQVDLENALSAQRSAEILEQNMPPQPILPPGGGMEAQKYPAGPSNVGLARAEEFGPVIAESEEALRRQASPIGGRNAEFAAQAFEDQAAVQSVAQGDLERAIAARQGATPEQIPDPARVQAEAFARELPPVEPPSNIELSAQAQQMQDADGWADGVIRRAFKGGRVSSNAFLDPELAAAVSVKGAQLLAKGVKDYDNWGGLMSKEFGEAVRPHLKDLWAKSNSASVMKTPEEFLRASVGDSAGNLRMKLGKRPGTGTAKNALVEFEDLQGRPIAVGADKAFGGKPFGTWASETEKWLNDSDISTFRNWYNELNSKFVSEYGEKRAPTMMMAWLAAQQNVDPSGALGNVFKVEDRLAGIGIGKKGGLADKKIEGVLTQQVQSKGFGAKLADFVDAGFQRRVRTYMGGDARGGEPFVADVHTGRDSGHVDHQTLSRLKKKADEGNLFIAGNPVTIKVTQTKTLQQGKEISQVPTRVRVTAEGMKPFALNIDQTSSPSGPRYEGISEWGNALTRDLNEKQWKGGNWTPSEVQAVGWMRILRQYGLPEESVATALAKNTGRVYAEVNYSSGAALRNTLPSFGQLPYDTQQAITKEVLEQAVPMIANKIGGSLRVRSISMGDGMFGGPKAPSTAVEVSGSTEAIDLFTVALAHVSEQAATMSVTFGLGGKNSRSVRFKKVDGSKFTGDEITSLIDDAKLGGFSVHQLPGGTEALITDAGKNFKPKGFSEKKAQRVFDQITTWADVRKVDIDIDIPTTRVTAYENDWSSHPKGQTYLEILNRRGIGSKVSDLDGLRGEYRTLLEQSFDRYAPGVRQGGGAVSQTPAGLGSSPAPSGFSPKSIAGFAYNPLLTNLGGAAGGFAYGFGEDPKASPEDRLINALKFAAVGGLAPSVARRAISALATRPKTPIGPRSAQTMTLEGQKKMFEHAPDAVTTAEVIKRFPGKVISEFQNALHEITRVEEKLRGSRPDLPMGDRFSLIAGAAGKAEVAFEPLLKLRNDLLKDMEPADLNVYLFNKRTIDRLTTQAKNEAAGLDKASREVLDYEIAISERLLREQEAQLGPDKWSRLEAFSDAYQKDADDNLRLVMSAGLMNQKQYDQIKADNGFYAPFKVMKQLYGREGMEGTNTSSMGSSVPFTKAVSGVTDQELKLGDMMVAAAENKLRAQVLAEKNRMMTDFAGLVPLDTNGDFIRRIAPHSKAPSGWETVSYAKDGLVQNLAVTPEIAKALKGLNPAQLGVYTGALKTLSTGLRVGATTALVAFQTFNHLRDQFRMTAMSKAGVRSVDDLVQFPLDYLEGLGSSLLRPFGYNTSLTKEYLASGAAGSTMSSNLRDNPYMRAAQAGNHAPVARLLGIPVESIIDTAAKIGNVLEETTKMTGYRRVARSENLKNLTGQAQKEALERIAYEVRNYVGSPDFAKAGNIGRELNAIFMFYNARLQGQTADMRRLIGRSGGPKEAAIAASKLTLMVGIPTTYIWFMNQRPENEQDYNSLSKFEKMAYLNIPRYDDNGQPFYRTNSKGVMVRQYYRAPKFDIYSQMANLVEGGLNFSKTKDPMALARAGENFLEGLSPFPISGDTLEQRAESVVSGVNPAVKAVVEFSSGRNTFRHQPTVPRNLENTSPEKQYTDATPEFFKRAAAAVPKSFGASFRSPLQLERLTENLTGGALTQLMKKTPEGVDPRKSNPIMSRFFSGPNVANEETWDLLDKLRTSDADQYIDKDRKLKDLLKRKGTGSWPAEVTDFIKEDPESNSRSFLQALKDETAGTTDADRTARRLSQESRAAYAKAAMDKIKTPEGRAKVLKQLVDREVVDRGTLLEMEVHRRLLEKKP